MFVITWRVFPLFGQHAVLRFSENRVVGASVSPFMKLLIERINSEPYLGASLEPMLKDQRASVFLALTVALTITATWWS